MSGPPPFDPTAVRAVVFDLDGTLIDSYEAITASLNHARAEFDLPRLDVETVRFRVGHGLEQLIADLVGPERVAAGVERFRERYAEVFLDRTSALPGAPETLATLKRRGYRLAVASNKPARFSVAILEHLRMLAELDDVAGPDVVSANKPDPAMLRHSLARLAVEPHEALYVGDMVLDVESALRAEMPVLLVEGGSSTREELRSTGQRSLPSVSALLGLLPAPPPGS